MQLFLQIVLSIQLAIGPFIWCSEVIRTLSTETTIVDLSTADTVTLLDRDTGESFKIVILEPEQTESTATLLFERFSEILFAPTVNMVFVLPDFERVLDWLCEDYLELFEAPSFELVDSE